MTNNDSDWITSPTAVDLMEKILECHRELTVQLTQQATNSGQVRSRTDRSPAWYVLEERGEQIILPDRGRGVIEVFRPDLEIFCQKKRAKRVVAAQEKTRRAPRQEAVALAIRSLWPGGVLPEGKERDLKIFDWLVQEGKISPSKAKLPTIQRTAQRVLKRPRNG